MKPLRIAPALAVVGVSAVASSVALAQIDPAQAIQLGPWDLLIVEEN